MSAFLKTVLQWTVTQLAGLFHSISSDQVHKTLDLVVAAATKFTSNGEKFSWVASELSKVYDGMIHSDGTASNKLNLLVSIALDLAQRFRLLPANPPAAAVSATPPLRPRPLPPPVRTLAQRRNYVYHGRDGVSCTEEHGPSSPSHRCV